jgi:hypothetical protein
MIAWHLLVVAFLVGFLDFLVFHVFGPRLRNAFLSFFQIKLAVVAWATLSGILSAAVLGVVMAAGYLMAGPQWLTGPTGPVVALALPVLLHHLAVAWPGSNQFGTADQRTRTLYAYRGMWEAARRRIEGRYSQCLEHMALEYASIPWDEESLGRIHARIVPRYRMKSKRQRVNPQLLVTLKKLRAERDVFTFFYSILEEFGPRTVDGLLARL